MNEVKQYTGRDIIALSVAVDQMQGNLYVKASEATDTVRPNFHILLEGIKNNSLVADENHYAKADEIISYFEGLVFKAIQRSLSEFEHKIVDLIKADNITINGKDSRLPIAPSLPSMYRSNLKHDLWADKERSLRAVSAYVGTIGERIEIEGQVSMCRYIARSHSLLVAVVKDDKHIVKFFYDLHRSLKSNKDINEYLSEGSTVKFTATVKKQEVSKFSQCKETTVNRVTISE
jgi:hypothetical protein